MRNSNHFDKGQWPDLWHAACRLLEQTVVPNQFHAWIHPLEWFGVEPTEHCLKVRMSAPNDFSAQMGA